MDFFGFHPLYVVILLALALIIFGPSRLPKMGAQVGRMLREFQVAREGLTQQMRDAFEEEPPDFGPSSGPTVAVAEEEPASEPVASTEGSVAVLDPPLGETVAAGILDPPASEASSEGQEADAGTLDPPASEAPSEGHAAGADTVLDPPAGHTVPEAEVTAGADLDPLVGGAVTPQPPAEVPGGQAAAGTVDAPVEGTVPDGQATGGVVFDTPVEEPHPLPLSGTELGEHGTSIAGSSGAVAEGPQAGATEPESPPPAGEAPFASIAAEHQAAPDRQEGARPD